MANKADLAAAVEAALSPDGPLARATPGFAPRAGQVQLACAVAQTFERGGALVAEAATGVGKTYAYLIPALLAGQRALLSTATKTLQDQLFGRDLPRLIEALGVPVQTALLKGRASYICPHRLAFAGQSLATHEAHLLDQLVRVEHWARGSAAGDLAELPALDERSPLVPLVTSTRENCLGADCPQFRACPVNRARRAALVADLVVINHHLFFADLAVRESGMAELLPTVRAVVFDEAHQLNEIGVQFLGRNLGTGQLLDLARDLLAAGLQWARGLADWPGLAARLERAARDLRLTAGSARGSRLRWPGVAPEGVDEAGWQQGMAAIAEALEQVGAGLDTVSELAPDFVRLAARAQLLAGRAGAFTQPAAPDAVRWLDVTGTLRLTESPLDIADVVRARLLGQDGSDEQDIQNGWEAQDAPGAPVPPPGRPKAERVPSGGSAPCAAGSVGAHNAWIFVSATLGDDERLTWFTEPCGLQDARVLRVGSPFDYARQAALYVPPDLARPGDSAHSAQVAQLAGDAAGRIGGRTLVLTTTLRALRIIGDLLAERLGASLDVLVQGQLPKRVILERFVQGERHGRGCVLVASSSFWEGVDVPGDALQLVVIDKLPFPPPDDPLVEARCKRLQAQGRSPFADFSLPEAAVALKQGAGRLIRRETDQGIVVICDTRLTGMSYGRRLLVALPPMRRLSGPAAFEAALADLARRA
ncbi:MAG: ATP-dependent DNA helicase [Burkholderiaceae bacterium]|jgi:ATP-dependent DNA helicase DinG|nr:ATP-dependent DNA helicase [Burkholderiaceae bacterium]